MSAAPPSSRDLDQFRDQADSFIRDLDEEYYLHFAGLKETLDVEQVYERYEELTKLETAQKLKEAPTELWRFACEGFLGNLTREHQARVAKAEAELEAKVDGETIPYRMLRVAMSNEPERDKRERLEEARLRLLDEHLNPVYLEAVQIDQEAVRRLDAPNYYELYKQFGFRLDEVAAECQELLDETERLWEREGDKLFRSRLGIGLGDARPWDVVRLFRAPELDKLYPNDQMLPALEHTLTDLGIDLRSQENVHLDLDARPSKSPRAFCAPIDVPGKVNRPPSVDVVMMPLVVLDMRGGYHRELRRQQGVLPDGTPPRRRNALDRCARAPRARRDSETVRRDPRTIRLN